jgi:hypothetical protein
MRSRTISSAPLASHRVWDHVSDQVADYGLKHGILLELSAILSGFKLLATSGDSIAETERLVPQGADQQNSRTAEQEITGTVASDLVLS